MHPRLIEAKAPSCPWPKADIATGRQDGTLVNFGELAPVVRSAKAKDPAALIRTSRVEWAATELLGLVSKKTVDALQAELAECQEEKDRLAALVAGGEELSAAEDKLRAALGSAPSTE